MEIVKSYLCVRSTGAQAAPHRTAPNHARPCRTVPCQTIARPNRAVPSQAGHCQDLYEASRINCGLGRDFTGANSIAISLVPLRAAAAIAEATLT